MKLTQVGAVYAAQALLCRCMLNVGLEDPDNLVGNLRESIFLETRFFEERSEERCSSLDGPGCFAAMMAAERGEHVQGTVEAVWKASDGPGVLPDRMLHGLGGGSGHEPVQFTTPEYSVLEAVHKKIVPTDQVAATVQEVRAGASRGMLHFTDLTPETRIPLTFSRGLPAGVIATWDGRWLARSCADVESGWNAPKRLALPAPEEYQNDALALLTAADISSQKTVSVTAHLTDSLGYLRFSEPVIVRSIFARWEASAGARPAIVGGRLGLQGVWTTNLDPAQLSGRRDWFDISGGSLQPVDEIAFIATHGLEVGAVEVVAHNDSEEELIPFMLMSPIVEPATEALAGPGTSFIVQEERLTAAATPFVISVQEAVDRNLRLRARPLLPDGHPKSLNVPGLITKTSVPPETEDTISWLSTASNNNAMFYHQHLLSMLRSAEMASTAPQGGDATLRAIYRLTQGLMLMQGLPSDVRRVLKNEQDSLLQALLGWVQGGGSWGHRTPLAVPWHGTEDAMNRYITAKRWQTKLDLLSVAFICGHHSSQ
uniref:Uncharacterized protein n=1 Tax=Noctiluca scintillans TaxID=2966 RepID=A0A7S1FE18_NOCSC|mmetsp:Transcript_53212/g.142328  ORF Transcript_53212/g.142328 Transcript_53212/m.142328 type:complete len:542 (+) Transcript_53212:61-1686(+)